MPQVIVTALFGAAFASSFIGGIVTAGLGLLMSFGLGLLYQALAPKPKQPGDDGIPLALQTANDAPRQIVFGEAALGGSLVYWHLSEADNKRLQMVIALSDHLSEGVSEVWVEDEKQAVTSLSGGYVGIDKYKSGTTHLAKYRFHDGADNQAADSDLISPSGGRWTNAHKLAGVAYVNVDLTYDKKVFEKGLPRFVWVVKGAKLYDPRNPSHNWNDKSTWSWTDNPAVVLYNLVRGIRIGDDRLFGLNCAAQNIDEVSFVAAANACDEQVPLKAGGTEKRYRVSAAFAVTQNPRAVIQDILAICAGRLTDSGGKIGLVVGVSQPVVATLTDDDLLSGEGVEIRPTLPRTELLNTALARYTEPLKGWQAETVPQRQSSADIASDGGVVLDREWDFRLCRSNTQAQRLLEIYRRRNRHQLACTLRLRMKWIGLEAGDWIKITSDRYGWTNVVFEVVHVDVAHDLTVRVALRRTDANTYSWTTADELDTGQVVDLPTGGARIDMVQGLAATTVDVVVGGNKRPALQVTWTPLGPDTTVDSVIIEWREQGSANVRRTTQPLPETGGVTIMEGVQGGAVYEVRALPICMPDRTTQWTAWVATASATAPVVVDKAQVADTALTVSPDSITIDSLADDVTAVLADPFDVDDVEFPLLGLLRQIHDDQAQQAQGITVESTLNGHTVKIEETATAVNGMAAQWAVQVSQDGVVYGAVQLNGANGTSQFLVAVDQFKICLNQAGDQPTAAFAAGQVAGVTQVGIKGDLLIDGSVRAESLNVTTLSAISADMGEITAGLLKSPDGKFVVDLTNKILRITA